MKTNKIIPFILGILLFVSCNSKKDIDVDQDVENAFFQQYEDATSLEWDIVENKYWVAEFRNDGSYCRAWYNNNAQWLMTETNELLFDKDLPEEIVYDFTNNRKCAKDNIINICKVEFSDVETRYVIEVNKDNSGFYLFYRRKGELFKTIQNYWDNRPIIITQEISDYIREKHDQETSIIDADLKDNPRKVEIYEKKYKTICFDSFSEWLATYWEIEIDEVPELVQKALSDLAGEKEVDGQFRLIYNASPETNTQTARKNVSINLEYPRLYVFKLKNGTCIYMNEHGEEVQESTIQL